MPYVGGKNYVYTPEGMAAADKARKSLQGAGGAPNSISVSGPGALGAPKASTPYGNMQQPMFGGMGVNGQGISGRSPVGGNRSSGDPVGPPSDLQNPQPGWSPIDPGGYQERPNFPPPSQTPGQGTPEEWERPPGSGEGGPVNPQKQDGDGNWYEWDGHQWKPIMGPKPLIQPGGWHGLSGLQDIPPWLLGPGLGLGLGLINPAIPIGLGAFQTLDDLRRSF